MMTDTERAYEERRLELLAAEVLYLRACGRHAQADEVTRRRDAVARAAYREATR